MRVVLDTVVIVRALLGPVSRSGRIRFEHARDYEWIVSQEIAAEYLDVPGRPVIASTLARRNRSRGRFLDLLATATVATPASIPAICRDPGDDKFLAAALAGNADFIVSEDLGLLSLGEYEGIVICNSQAMINRFSAADAR